MKEIHAEDLVFLILFAFLFFFAIVNLLTGAFAFLFTPSPSLSGTSVFADMTLIVVLSYSIIWGLIQIINQYKGAKGTRSFSISKTLDFIGDGSLNFIGLRKPSSKELLFIILSMIIGIIFNFLLLLALSRFTGGTLIRVTPPLYTLVQDLVQNPILEELIFRGIYLSVFLKLFGKTYVSAGSGLVLSSFTFGWCHPFQPIFKMIGGFFLGFIYLFGWKKNFAASILAHFGVNLIGTFIWIV